MAEPWLSRCSRNGHWFCLIFVFVSIVDLQGREQVDVTLSHTHQDRQLFDSNKFDISDSSGSSGDSDRSDRYNDSRSFDNSGKLVVNLRTPPDLKVGNDMFIPRWSSNACRGNIPPALGE